MIKILGEQSSIPQEILIARKRETQSVSGTDLVGVSGLGATLVAGADYLVRGLVFITAGGTGGAKFAFVSPASAHVIKCGISNWITPEDSVTQLATSQSTEVEASLPAGDHAFEIDGVILGATGHDFRIIAAQSSANDALTIYFGSYLHFIRIK